MAEYALIIGINHYKDDESIPKLKWAEEDASEFYSVLTNPLYCGIPLQNITLLLNERATRDNIIKGIGELRTHARINDTVFICFAGHGSSEWNEERGDQDDHLLKYLVPHDTQVNNLDASAIDFKFLSERLDRINAERMLILLDCCYSGAAGGRTFLVPGSREVGPLRVGPSFLQNISGVGRVVISACGSDELARELDELRHGIFSYYLIQGLKGHADYRNDGVIDLNELWIYLSSETSNKSAQRQHPVMTGMIKGPPFILSRPRTLSLTLEQKKELEDHLAIKYGKHRLQTVKIADDASFEKLALEAARYLDERLTNNFRVSVSCGRTLSETISQMTKKTLHNIEMFPLNVYLSETVEIIDSNILTALLRTRFSGINIRAHLLPTFIPNGMMEEVRSLFEQVAGRIFKLAKHSDLFLFGIGQPAAPNANVAYVLRKANLTSDKLQELGVVGKINFHLYDKDGQFLISKTNLPHDQRDYLQQYYRQFFAFSVEELKEVAESSGVNLVAVAGGDDKHDAILGAIKAGFVRTLITDIETAQWLAEIGE